MPRSITFCLLPLLALALPAFASAAPPNMVVIMADDLGYSDIGCYGGEIKTPNLDQLARNGLRFSQFYNTARCWPSRAAVLTGYYAQQVRRDAIPGLEPTGGQGSRPAWAKLLPQYLRPMGYRAYHSGKWHVDGPVLAGGFDHSYALNDHDRNFYPKNHTEDDKPLPPVEPGTGYFTSTAIADYSIKYLKEHAQNHAGKPFLSFVAFTSPHFPVQAPAEDIAKYHSVYDKGWDDMRLTRLARQKELGIFSGDISAMERDQGPPYAFPEAIKKLGPNEVNRPLDWASLSTDQKAYQASKMAVHAAMVDRMDAEIGRIIDQLKAMNVLDNTIIMFVSDNGASAEMMVRGDGHDPSAPAGSGKTFLSIGPGWSSLANTPFRKHKTWVHEGGIATPFIVHWPAGIAARGEIRHTPAHLIDVVPTLLAAAGTSAEKAAEADAPASPGKNLLPAFTTNATVARDHLWWLHEGNRALRVGDWKIVATKAGEWELYNLSADRAETKNLAASMPDKVREMAEVWTKTLDEFKTRAAKDIPATKPAARKKARKAQ